jgi:4-hydroxy-tetrahydrodipicolinate synthase
LSRVLVLAKSGRLREAQPVFEAILPQIVYSLQNMELFHQAEKRLLRARGVLRNVTVRSATVQPSAHDFEYMDLLNERILRLLDELHLPGTGAEMAGEEVAL